jgi:sec-independent protein translocase protein TatB
MDILGIGFPELVFIMVIAMMVFGPRRLPEIAAKAGKLVADLRGMSQGLMPEWRREIAIASQLEELEKARRDLGEIKNSVMQTGKSISAGSAEIANSIAPSALPGPQTAKNNAAAPVARSNAVANPNSAPATSDAAQPSSAAPEEAALSSISTPETSLNEPS